MEISSSNFNEIWCVDFEFRPRSGELPEVICMVACELKTRVTIRLWKDDLFQMSCPPFSINTDSIFIAYYSTAEFSCFHALGWPLPVYVIDLFVEFRNITNIQGSRQSASLLSALVHFGLDALSYEERESMRALALRGEPFTEEEKALLLNYCAVDVFALQKLFPCMITHFSLPHALLRGRYMKAVSIIERNGVPIEIELLSELMLHWDAIEDLLIEKVNKDFHVFEGRVFKQDNFEKYLKTHNLSWPRRETGRLMLDEDTFHEMVKIHPQIAPIKELRYLLSQLRLADLEVGSDGRNRTSLSPFRAMTGRNQPSNAKFIFGPSCWIRSLIKPQSNHSIAYIDWCQQEVGIAAALSGDPNMREAYLSGDPYLAFAKQAGAIPHNATKQSHGAVRDQFKACVLAVQYGMGEASLAIRINQPVIQARHLLQLHRDMYSIFWKWSDAAVTHAMLTGQLQTVFGWRVRIENKSNERSLRNFSMQANGAEMLRLACCYMTEANIEVCAPVHDAVLIHAPTSRIESVIVHAQSLMEKASCDVLNDFKLKSEAKTVHYSERYMDERGEKMWKKILSSLEECKTQNMTQNETLKVSMHDT